jgi:outer membrane lipoprotein-sorting protein
MHRSSESSRSMRPLSFFFLTLFLPLLLHGQTAYDIIKRSEDLIRGESSRGSFRMTVLTPEYSRTIVMDSWWKGTDKALIEIQAPPREAGNKTLKVGNELWMYLRNTETTIKVPPSMMMQSWNGSHFTNDDLVRESSLADDYTMTIAGHDTVDGAPSWIIDLRPKPTSPVVWGRILHWVRKSDYLPGRTEYFDEKGTLVRTMVYLDFKKFGVRTLPGRWRMIDNLKPGEYTELEYLILEFNVNISDRMFSFRELERGRRR